MQLFCLFPRDFSLNIKRGKITLLPSVASKMRRAHFPNECDFFTFLSPLLFFSLFLLSFTSLIFFNNSLLYNYVLAIFWLQHIERRLRFFDKYNNVPYENKPSPKRLTPPAHVRLSKFFSCPLLHCCTFSFIHQPV